MSALHAGLRCVWALLVIGGIVAGALFGAALCGHGLDVYSGAFCTFGVLVLAATVWKWQTDNDRATS